MYANTSFVSFSMFLFFSFKITPANNIAAIKTSSFVSLDAMFVARFVAAAFGEVAGRNLLRSKVAQQKSRNKSLVCHQPNDLREQPFLFFPVFDPKI